MKIAFHTLGCKVNQYETEAMKEQFAKSGHEIKEETDFADVYIVNTCTVTNLADRKSRQYIRRMKKLNPDSVIAVTGCYVQVSSEKVKEIPEVDIVAGTNEKHKILDYVNDFIKNRESSHDKFHVKPYEELKNYEETGLIISMESRTRAYIKIEEGCNRFCSYCVIPYARGPVRSRDASQIIKEANKLIDSGFKELILTGINTALYEDLPGLLSKLDQIPGDFRIRLSSLEPTVVNAEFVKTLFNYKKLCRHLHLSLQSGSDNILRSMNRKYNIEEYFEIVNTLREFDPLYGITTDIIVGFPGESQEDFQASIKAVERAEYGKVHAFRYSKRPGTKAENMDGQLSATVKKDRSNLLIQAGEKVATKFNEKNIGSTAKVLFETFDEKTKLSSGYTDNYIKVYAKDDGSLRNRFAIVELKELYNDGLFGIVQEEK